MKRPAAALAAAVLTVTVLAGCGDDGKNSSDDASETSTPSQTPGETPSESSETPTATDFGTPAKGARIKGKSYTFRAPQSWTDITTSARGVEKSIDSAAAEPTKADGFLDSVNVTFDKAAAGTTLDDLAASVPDQLKGVVKKLDVAPRVRIGDVESLHHRGLLSDGSTKYYLDQFVTIAEDGTITVISFNFSPGLKKGPREDVVNSVLASWKWAS